MSSLSPSSAKNQLNLFPPIPDASSPHHPRKTFTGLDPQYKKRWEKAKRERTQNSESSMNSELNTSQSAKTKKKPPVPKFSGGQPSPKSLKPNAKPGSPLNSFTDNNISVRVNSKRSTRETFSTDFQTQNSSFSQTPTHSRSNLNSSKSLSRRKSKKARKKLRRTLNSKPKS